MCAKRVTLSRCRTRGVEAGADESYVPRSDRMRWTSPRKWKQGSVEALRKPSQAGSCMACECAGGSWYGLAHRHCCGAVTKELHKH